ncbi:hypothetical protein IFT72_15000 [Frigoribacterium sp. CFBP 8754]|uniref:hypothetical protein n=1 Tax=Frigoribacterium sp. CFBP 8754 TaxID=2775290 RepID=UPI0017866A9E|nr:hypothetical protein [Frigoribacterium sp. CFBP 8754]MBD8661495.1 hypothetical protein [Frigoribacterium sp. CFBP 8754]
MDWSLVLDKLVDVVVGIGTTVLGILIVYAIARPRVEFAQSVQLERRPGFDRYGLLIRGTGIVRIMTMRAEVFLQVPGRRHTSVPIPLSRDTWTNVRRNRRRWRAAPRLLLNEVDWARHLPGRVLPPGSMGQLETVMENMNAKLFVRITATSNIFSVTTVRTRRYSFVEVREAVELEPSE